MLNNKRIASELKRIAKGLVSSPREVANTAGEYKKFTGTIEWKGSNARVRNATFELSRNGIVWQDGVWEGGIWENGIWWDGTWRDGVWKGGDWQDGKWKGGNWKNGKWERGRDKRGVERTYSPDNW